MNHRSPPAPRAWLAAALPLALFCSSCVLGPEIKSPRRISEGKYCAPLETLGPAPQGRAAESADVPATAAVARGYSPRSLDVARAIGAIRQVERLAEAVTRHAPDAELADLRGQVNDSISLATLELASAVAHLSCEEGRATQIASDLRAAESTQTRNVTAWSLLLGAAAATAGGVLAVTNKNAVPGAVVGIGGGLAGAAFGFATLAIHRSVKFTHSPNILGELWRGDAHPSFPDVVWAYLTRPQFSRTGDKTLRDSLMATWRESGALGDDPAHPLEARTTLYFGSGGTYDAGGLDDRANMLSDVREVVSLFNHGLRRLASDAAER